MRSCTDDELSKMSRDDLLVIKTEVERELHEVKSEMGLFSSRYPNFRGCPAHELRTNSRNQKRRGELALQAQKLAHLAGQKRREQAKANSANWTNVNAPPIAPMSADASEVLRLRSRVAELEAKLSDSSANDVAVEFVHVCRIAMAEVTFGRLYSRASDAVRARKYSADLTRRAK